MVAGVMISGTQQGTVTDVDGRYGLNLPSADVSLEFYVKFEIDDFFLLKK